MKPRHPLVIQRDVITAIFLRDMKSRFSGYVLGNFWLVLEPMMMISLFIVFFGLRGRGEFGYAEPAVFILAAFLPFKMLWQFTMNKCRSASGRARQLVMFRQITLLDIFLTTALMEYLLFVFIGVILITVLAWFGLDPMPKDVLLVLGYSTLLWLIGMSVGIISAMLSRFAKEVQIILGILTFPALILSAVFFPMSIIPEPYRSYLAWNPLVHAVEFIREAWLGIYVSPVASHSYLFAWVLGLLFAALSQYSLNWRRLIAQ